MLTLILVAALLQSSGTVLAQEGKIANPMQDSLQDACL